MDAKYPKSKDEDPFQNNIDIDSYSLVTPLFIFISFIWVKLCANEFEKLDYVEFVENFYYKVCYRVYNPIVHSKCW